MIQSFIGDKMIVTFCGHRDFFHAKQYEEKLVAFLIMLASKNEFLDCYCGGYGQFDDFAARCARSAKKISANIRCFLIIPYITTNHQNRLKYIRDHYDGIIYPPLEKVPYRLAIIRRNEWMIDNADVVVSYVDHSWGGAAKTLAYAKKKKKFIFQLIKPTS